MDEQTIQHIQKLLKIAKEKEKFYNTEGPLYKAHYWSGRVDSLELLLLSTTQDIINW